MTRRQRFVTAAEQLFVPASRVAGVSYMVAGGVLALILLPGALFGTVEQRELGASTLTATENELLETAFDGQFTLDATQPYTDEIPIIYQTDDSPEHVFFYAVQTSTGEIIEIGRATAAEAGTWKYLWPVADVTPDSYRIAAVVESTHSYEDRADDLVNVAAPESIAVTLAASADKTDWEDEALSLDSAKDTFYLKWEADSAETCTSLAGDLDINEATSGLLAVSAPPTGSTESYGVTCVRGEETRHAEVKVTATDTADRSAESTTDTQTTDTIPENPITSTLSARANEGEWQTDTLTVRATDTLELRWEATGAESGCVVYADAESISEASSGELMVAAPGVGESVVYTLYCRAGEFSKTIELTVSTPTFSITATTSPAEVEEVLAPPIDLVVSGDPHHLSGQTTVTVNTAPVEFVELYLQNPYSNQPQFLNLANQVAPGEWVQRWDTTQIPNGTYKLYAHVKNEYGLYESEPVRVVVDNPSRSPREDEQNAELEAVAQSIDRDAGVEPTRPIADALIQQRISPDDTDPVQTVDEMFQQFENAVRHTLDDFRQAVRRNDPDAMARAREELAAVRGDMMQEVRLLVADDEVLVEIGAAIDKRLDQRLDVTEERETLLRDRIGDAVTRDSDQDQLTDYDEINLYNTDPHNPDTDNDGFIDGVEVARGYDPLDPAPEALVQYQSPKAVDVVREGILSVSSITTVTASSAEAEDSDGVNAQAVISGRALPNSFVTLYIFSEPIVVTVRADESGSWRYVFDKELADGTHEIYAGITDNAGRVVARSNPFAFVKTAQAFTPVDGAAGGVTASPEPTGFASDQMLMLIGAVSIVAMGALLVILGMYVDRRTRVSIHDSAYV